MRAGSYVEITGRLVADPVAKEVKGTTVKEFSLAVDQSSGAHFFDVVLWGEEAEGFSAKKGQWVQIEGSLRQDRWKDKTTGDARSRVRVNADFAMPVDLTITRARNEKLRERAGTLEVGSRVQASLDLPESAVTRGESGVVDRISSRTVTVKFDSGARATLSREDAATLVQIAPEQSALRSNNLDR